MSIGHIKTKIKNHIDKLYIVYIECKVKIYGKKYIFIYMYLFIYIYYIYNTKKIEKCRQEDI